MADPIINGIDEQDADRRNIGFLSLQLKIDSAQKLINAASASIDDVAHPKAQSGDASASLYLKMEAAFAAIDESIRNLELAQILCAKLGSSNIPRLQRYKQAVESGGQIVAQAPPQTAQ